MCFVLKKWDFSFAFFNKVKHWVLGKKKKKKKKKKKIASLISWLNCKKKI